MTSIRHIFLLLLAFVLQTTWIDFLEVYSLKPDLILLVLVYIALREEHSSCRMEVVGEPSNRHWDNVHLPV